MQAHRVIAIVLFPALAMLTGCDPASPSSAVRLQNERPVMGTIAKVIAIAPDHDTAMQAIDAAHGRLADVNRLMSDYIADSEVGRLNRTPAGEGLVVSDETFFCIRQAARISERSGGALDVTCRPLVTLWKEAGRSGTLPSDAEREAAQARVGWKKLAIDESTHTITPTVDDMQVDLGGIAKGYALDLSADAMLEAGATAGLIDVGGDLRVVGTPIDRDRWSIGLRDPRSEDRMTLIGRLGLKDGAVATSGVQERFTEIEGRRFSHIIDPRSGWPAEESPSVTVVAADGLTADAWATVFSVLSVDEGRALYEEDPPESVEVLWITIENGAIVAEMTPGFDKYLNEWTEPVVPK